jgi:hypothetical protein
VTALLGFVDARLAVHTGRPGDDGAIDDGAIVAGVFAQPPSGWCDMYARAAAAELAVVSGLPDAADRLAAAAPAGDENDWAAACLARTAGRLHVDPGTLADSVAHWERIGARYERACTLLLLSERAAEGRAELDVLGVSPPGRSLYPGQ